jgi:hypothetical protein
LLEAAKETFTPYLGEFEKAMNVMSGIDVGFYDVDTQFCLDVNLFKEEADQ